MNNEPTAEPIDPNDEPDEMKPSATGLLIGDDGAPATTGAANPGDDGAAPGPGQGVAHPTGQRQAEENAENEPPA